MRKIVLIECVKKKRAYKCRARDLYTSSLFTKYLQYAERLSPDSIFILSAKYGLLELGDEIEPYDLTLKRMPVREAREWARRVLEQISAKADLECDQFVFLAGVKYREYLVPHLKHVEIPFEHVDLFHQLQMLSA